jgi:hypothetical protein
MTKVCCGPFPPMPASLTLFMRSPDLSRRTRCERVRGWCLKTPVLGLWLVDSVTGSREGVHRRVLHVGLPVYPAGDYDLPLSPHPWSTSVAHTYPHGPKPTHTSSAHIITTRKARSRGTRTTTVPTVIFHGVRFRANDGSVHERAGSRGGWLSAPPATRKLLLGHVGLRSRQQRLGSTNAREDAVGG